jgi:diphosphomevalonate decarboxylase
VNTPSPPASGPPAEGKATASAPANIAFIKYWGARDLDRALPLNPSISMTLTRCRSRTTVEVLPGPGDDEVLVAGGRDDGSNKAAVRRLPENPGMDPDTRAPTADRAGDVGVSPGATPVLRPADAGFAARVRHHLDEIRRWAGLDPGATAFRVATVNSFPAAAGLASSASGFAALTVATLAALGREATPAELSSLARRSGSGSAARSVLGGYVEWPGPESADPDDPVAAVLAPAAHWDLRDLIAIVETGAKEVSSLAGHRRAPTSPYFGRRLEALPHRLAAVRRAILDRDFATLGPLIEEEAIDLHLIAMSSRPPIFYWKPATLEVLAALRTLRREGVPAWATIDAGANVHSICTPDAEAAVAARLAATPGVLDVIRDRVGEGPELHDEHLL